MMIDPKIGNITVYSLCVFVRFYTHENLHAYNYKQKMYAKKILR